MMIKETNYIVNRLLIIILITVISCSKEENINSNDDDLYPLITLSPRFSLLAGTYGNDTVLIISSGTENAQIYYTIEGSEPTINSKLYLEPIEIKGNSLIFEIKAIATKENLENSFIVSSYYRIDYSFDPNDTIKNLSLNDFKSNIIGKWIGNSSNPWYDPYNIKVDFINEFRLEAYTISTIDYSIYTSHTEGPFYYDRNGEGDYEIIEIIDSCLANGSINGMEIIKMRFLNNYQNLVFEIYKEISNEIKGPIVIKLLRLPD